MQSRNAGSVPSGKKPGAPYIACAHFGTPSVRKACSREGSLPQKESCAAGSDTGDATSERAHALRVLRSQRHADDPAERLAAIMDGSYPELVEHREDIVHVACQRAACGIEIDRRLPYRAGRASPPGRSAPDAGPSSRKTWTNAHSRVGAELRGSSATGR